MNQTVAACKNGCLYFQINQNYVPHYLYIPTLAGIIFIFNNYLLCWSLACLCKFSDKSSINNKDYIYDVGNHKATSPNQAFEAIFFVTQYGTLILYYFYGYYNQIVTT